MRCLYLCKYKKKIKMQSAKCKIILESLENLRSLESLRICTVKCIKLPVLIKLLTVLLPGIVFDTYGYGVRVTAVEGY